MHDFQQPCQVISFLLFNLFWKILNSVPCASTTSLFPLQKIYNKIATRQSFRDFPNNPDRVYFEDVI